MRFLRALMMVIVLLSFSASTAGAEGKFRVGDQGTEIAELQGKLVVLGYDVIADGAFGPAMAEAVKDFQKSHGIKADFVNELYGRSLCFWRNYAFRF